MLATAFLTLVLAAPAPSKADVIVGEFDLQLQSPVVCLPDADESGGRKVYWIVCDLAVENQAMKFLPGDRVKVTGKIRATGTFRYIIADSISKDE